MSLAIKKNDTVFVRSGKDRGRRGRVLRVFPGKGKALVEGVNMARCHERQRGQTQPGGIVSKEAPIALSRLMLVDPKTNEPGRFRTEARDGKKVRVHVKTSNVV
ncbi:MAG TPA: 50S ribosomal protein L24 [Sumerlaeia bacterium]|nr:50S ribosomal protein L24 [Sumerlaeia bacterium]